VEDLSGLVNRPAIRILLAGAMVHLTDERPAPADLVLEAVAEEGGAVVTVTLHPTQGDQGIVAEQNYRKLVWQDVQALAEAEGVRVEREGERVSLRFAWVRT
jgi:hypothetical protein